MLLLPIVLFIYMLFVCVIMCCIIFNLALKATFRSFDLFRSFFACCLFCFVFIFPLRTTPRPSRSKKVVRSSGPLVHRVRRRRTAPVASAAPATRPAPPETATSASVVTPNATMIQGIAKAVSEAVIQSLTPLWCLTSLIQPQHWKKHQLTTHLIMPLGQMPLSRGLWLLLFILSQVSL